MPRDEYEDDYEPNYDKLTAELTGGKTELKIINVEGITLPPSKDVINAPPLPNTLVISPGA